MAARGSTEKEVGLVCAIRVRPLKEREGRSVWKAEAEDGRMYQTTAEGDAVAEKAGSTSFRFDYVFEASTQTKTVYDSVAREIVDGVLEGVNGTLFAYGQTSSGKTYTMQGGANGVGVVQLAADQIFERIAERPDFDFLLRCSYIEVYNEVLRDLLAAPDAKNGAVQVREDAHKRVYVDGATEEIVTDAAGIVSLLARGDAARSVGATAMNERSSRSHAVFRIVVESKATAGEEAGGVLVGALSLVDLAGSESVRHTGATGQRAKEGGKINQSLLTLSRVVKQLGDRGEADSAGEPFVNFRDSKLTRLLQPTLGGDARLAMICCVAPSEAYVEETRSTLQFAQRAAKIRLAPKVHEVLDDASQLRRVKRQLAELQRKQQEYDHLGRSGKTEELSRLLDANTQLSEAVAHKEAELSTQIEMMGRLKRMIVLGGSVVREEDDVSRLGANGFITTRGHRGRRRARETWAPGAALFTMGSATAKLPAGLFAAGNAEDADLIVFEEDELESPPAKPPAGATPTNDRRRSSDRPSPGALLSAQFSEHRKRAAAQLAEVRGQLDEALARAYRAERDARDARVELRAECAAADEDADKRQLPALDGAADDDALLALCAALRARRERWRRALDAATDERAVAQREAYVLKQEVVELREISESFDAHVAEIDAELDLARRDAIDLRTDLEAARADLAARDADLAAARDQTRAADASRDAALDRLATAELENADRHDAALRRRAAAVEAVERDATDLRQRLAESDAALADLRAELDATKQQAAAAHAQLDAARRDLAAKSARVARLEQVKMTTDIFKKIQQMQLDKARAEGENAELRAQLAQLEADLIDAKHDDPEHSSPFRDAAAALSRGSASSVAATLQLDELASRNADLQARNADLAAIAADALDKLGLDAAALRHPDPDLDAVRATLAHTAATDLDAKLKFLEQENLDLMLEIKQIRGGGHHALVHDAAALQPRLDNTATPLHLASAEPPKTTTPALLPFGKENTLDTADFSDSDKPPECAQS